MIDDNEYIRRDNVPLEERDKKIKHPRRVEKQFLKKKGLIRKIPMTKDNIEEPLLLLLKNNQDAEFIEGQNEGEFTIKKPNGKHKQINLDNKKLFSLRTGGERILVWIHYEDEATSYPHDVNHDSRMLRLLTQKLLINRREMDQGDDTNWLIIIMVVVAIVFIIGFFMMRAGVINFG